MLLLLGAGELGRLQPAEHRVCVGNQLLEGGAAVWAGSCGWSSIGVGGAGPCGQDAPWKGLRVPSPPQG